MVQGAIKVRSRQRSRVLTWQIKDSGQGCQQGQVKTMVQGANNARSRQWSRVPTRPSQDKNCDRVGGLHEQ